MINPINIKRLIFDADDTLWENNIHYIKAFDDFVDLISGSELSKQKVAKEFQDLEKKVVKERGYGGENYLYILHTLFEKYRPLFNSRGIAIKFEKICNTFQSHLYDPPKLFPETRSVLIKLAKKYPLYVLTKGNIEEQHRKLEGSELLKYFRKVFIETEKNISTYRHILSNNNWLSDEVCMIGNSPKSDINPALTLGMYAVLIPYQHTWILEDEPLVPNQDHLEIIKSLRDLISIFNEDY
jgi:putative hydrolase of the HAD superfamily